MQRAGYQWDYIPFYLMEKMGGAVRNLNNGEKLNSVFPQKEAMNMLIIT